MSSRARAASCSGSAMASRSCARRSCCPGALLPNVSLKFVFRQVVARRRSDRYTVHARLRAGQRLSIPVKHTTGRFYAPEPARPARVLGQVLLRYAPGQNPNGSLHDIAGVCNEPGNVFGLMPHPEHAVDPLTGSTDGLKIFESMRAHVGSTSSLSDARHRAARADRRRVRPDRRRGSGASRATSSWRCCR